MPQIKITVNEEEKSRYEMYAALAGVSLSKYLKSRIDSSLRAAEGKVPEPSLPDRISSKSVSASSPDQSHGKAFKAPSTHLNLHLDSRLVSALKEQAADLGLSLQDYVSLLLEQKGKPVIIQYSADFQSEFSLWFLEWMKDIEAIADAARISGNPLSIEQLRKATDDFTNAASDLRKVTKRIDRKLSDYIRDLNQELRAVKKSGEQI